MQIQGDYSYSNNNYEHKHTHHITKCLHEEGRGRQPAAAAGMKSDSLSVQSAKQEAEQEPLIFTRLPGKSRKEIKRVQAFLREFGMPWETKRKMAVSKPLCL